MATKEEMSDTTEEPPYKCARLSVGSVDEASPSKIIETRAQDMIQEMLKRRALEQPRCPFQPLDNVHGQLHLPELVKVFVDKPIFQRMRNIKQLGVCELVYPGATHTRFNHSIGTSFLAYELMKDLHARQPDLYISNRDVLCVTIAALCHDLGHPCFSHMFEDFLHQLGSKKRKEAMAEVASGKRRLTVEEEKNIRGLETWSHEQASIFLLNQLLDDLKDPIFEAGLRVDDEGDDFAFIRELIDPPKKLLDQLLESNSLKSGWSKVVFGRGVEKAWMYEVVSNWRSGIDVDKFDYFRRDCQFLGFKRQFDHDRYMKSLIVVEDPGGVVTLSPPEKEKDVLREDVLQLRQLLHRRAYQHKTVKKFEFHMIDILNIMDEYVRIKGVGGKEMKMSEAAVAFDPVAYPKLTDMFVESRLQDREDQRLDIAADMYQRHFLERQIMRLIGNWDLPRSAPSGKGPFAVPSEEAIVSGVLGQYESMCSKRVSTFPVRKVDASEIRSKVARLHYGMGDRDPLNRVVFHTPKIDAATGKVVDCDAKPLKTKIFLFWNPPIQDLKDDVTRQRLIDAFRDWASQMVSSPAQASACSPAPAPPKKRKLKIEASCTNQDPW